MGVAELGKKGNCVSAPMACNKCCRRNVKLYKSAFFFCASPIWFPARPAWRMSCRRCRSLCLLLVAVLVVSISLVALLLLLVVVVELLLVVVVVVVEAEGEPKK